MPNLLWSKYEVLPRRKLVRPGEVPTRHPDPAHDVEKARTTMSPYADRNKSGVPWPAAQRRSGSYSAFPNWSKDASRITTLRAHGAMTLTASKLLPRGARLV